MLGFMSVLSALCSVHTFLYVTNEVLDILALERLIIMYTCAFVLSVICD